MKNIIFIFVFTCLVFASFSANAKNGTYRYEPVVYNFEGVIRLLTFPGPPNYHSIKEGDTVERGYYLQLDQPIDVISKKTDEYPEIDETERNVELMQLIIMDHVEKSFRFLDKIMKSHACAKIRGQLTHAITGHHHTRVLVTVEKIAKGGACQNQYQRKVPLGKASLDILYH